MTKMIKEDKFERYLIFNYQKHPLKNLLILISVKRKRYQLPDTALNVFTME